MSDLEIESKDLIEQIKQAFAEDFLKNATRPQNFVKGYSPVTSERLRKTLEGKSWEEAAMNPNIVNDLSEIDHLRDINDEAYVYYLPAFLIGTLLYPNRWIYYSSLLEKISDLLSHFSSKQLEALIAFFAFHIREWMHLMPLFSESDENPVLRKIEEMQRISARISTELQSRN